MVILVEDPDTDELIVGRCLPAHLMYLLACDLLKKGWILREDTRRNLNAASAAPLIKLPPYRQQRLAKKIDSIARGMLRWLNPNDTEGLYTCALFTLKLVDEGLLDDAANQAVLVALVLVEDARAAGSEWTFREVVMAPKARDLIRQAQLQGLYLRPPKRPMVISV